MTPRDPGQSTTPNHYDLHGRHLRVSYFPHGFGPVSNAGPIILSYQDAHRSRAFHRDDVSVVDVTGLGTVVSVTLVAQNDAGSTTFALIVPRVELRGTHSAPIHTSAITAIHKGFIRPMGQDETYTVTDLRGTAATGPLPD
jgi:hypothetical protein